MEKKAGRPEEAASAAGVRGGPATTRARTATSGGPAAAAAVAAAFVVAAAVVVVVVAAAAVVGGGGGPSAAAACRSCRRCWRRCRGARCVASGPAGSWPRSWTAPEPTSNSFHVSIRTQCTPRSEALPPSRASIIRSLL